jgi:glyoxylase-like metal-dependent hydrolase (beta-lactamase superfamily II)
LGLVPDYRYFENANVIHAGDFFLNGFYPLIDVHHGGSRKGVLRAVDKVLRIVDDETKIIPGHAPWAISRRPGVTAFSRANAGAR